MKYDVTLKLRDHKGRVCPTGTDLEGKPVGEATLGDVLEQLCVASPGVTDPQEKHKIYQLLRRISDAKPTFQAEAAEVALLKKLAGAAYPPAMMGIVWDALESPLSETPVPAAAAPTT